jgi:hypothetical protein
VPLWGVDICAELWLHHSTLKLGFERMPGLVGEDWIILVRFGIPILLIPVHSVDKPTVDRIFLPSDLSSEPLIHVLGEADPGERCHSHWSHILAVHLARHNPQYGRPTSGPADIGGNMCGLSFELLAAHMCR